MDFIFGGRCFGCCGGERHHVIAHEFRRLGAKISLARLRCEGSESYWDGGELWTDTRFEVVERNKGLLGASITVRMLGARMELLRMWMVFRNFDVEKKFIYFCGA